MAIESSDPSNVDTLKVGTGWIELTVCSEPLLVLTARGYAPVLIVTVAKSGLQYKVYISAKSLAERLEVLRKGNNGLFRDLKFRLRKSGAESMSPYEVELR